MIEGVVEGEIEGLVEGVVEGLVEGEVDVDCIKVMSLMKKNNKKTKFFQNIVILLIEFTMLYWQMFIVW